MGVGMDPLTLLEERRLAPSVGVLGESFHRDRRPSIDARAVRVGGEPSGRDVGGGGQGREEEEEGTRHRLAPLPYHVILRFPLPSPTFRKEFFAFMK